MGNAIGPLDPDPPHCLPPKLIGNANELQASIEDVPCSTLVDTGSQVTSVKQFLPGAPSHPSPAQLPGSFKS